MQPKIKHFLLTMLLLVPLLLVTGCGKDNSGLSPSLMEKGAVTKTFKQANFSSNVIFYDPKTTPDVALANFDTSEYRQIDLLMYSDGCETCNKKKDILVKDIKYLLKKHDLIILINSDQDLKPMKKKFKFNNNYHYPTLLSFKKNDDGKLDLVNQLYLGNRPIDD